MTQAPDARFWDALAEDYAKKPLPNPDATAKKLAVIRAQLRPTDRLLDLGCGTGTIVLDLAGSVAEAHGFDLSPNMIAIADRKAAGVRNVTFAARPAAGLEDVPDASFDVVLAFNLLHLVDDPPALARSIARVLRPGGLFVSSTPCLGGSWFPPYFLVLPMLRWIGKAPAVTLLTADDVRAAVRDAGFVDVREPDVGRIGDSVFVTGRKV